MTNTTRRNGRNNEDTKQRKVDTQANKIHKYPIKINTKHLTHDLIALKLKRNLKNLAL